MRIHIILFNSKGQTVLQQRSWGKAAKEELLEEMGIEAELTLKRIGLNKKENQSEFY